MKRCSECRRDYFDDSLLYCLDDGTALLEGPATADESATAVLSRTAAAEISDRFGDQRTELLKTGFDSFSSASNSIAVLPFANMSSDADNEYFCDGLAEEL